MKTLQTEGAIMPYESFYRIRSDLSAWNSLALLKANDETSQSAVGAVLDCIRYCFFVTQRRAGLNRVIPHASPPLIDQEGNHVRSHNSYHQARREAGGVLARLRSDARRDYRQE